MNESLHSLLNASQPYNISRSTLESLQMQIGIAVFETNRKYLILFYEILFWLHNRKYLNNEKDVLNSNIVETIVSSSFNSNILHLESKSFLGTTYEKLLDLGFCSKSKKDSIWSLEDIDILKKACDDILSGSIKIQVKDPLYYISHYIFHGTKTRSEVEGKLNQQLRSVLDEK